jgi:hypothetical protein
MYAVYLVSNAYCRLCKDLRFVKFLKGIRVNVHA